MHINDEGLKLVKSFEGLRLTAYVDAVGVWTIGYGHTKGVKKGMTITEAQATEYLKEDLTESEHAVDKWMNLYKFNSNEYSALVSFTFNCGAGSLNNLVKNGARTKGEISRYITLYNKGANGKYLEGLARRRRAEKALFDKDVAPASQPVEPANPNNLGKYTDIYNVAVDVCRGKYGDNADRVANLTKAGYDAKEVQKEVNRIFKYGYILGQSYTVDVYTYLNIRNACNFNCKILGRYSAGTKIVALDVLCVDGVIWIKTNKGFVCAKTSNSLFIK